MCVPEAILIDRILIYRAPKNGFSVIERLNQAEGISIEWKFCVPGICARKQYFLTQVQEVHHFKHVREIAAQSNSSNFNDRLFRLAILNFTWEVLT